MYYIRAIKYNKPPEAEAFMRNDMIPCMKCHHKIAQKEARQSTLAILGIATIDGSKMTVSWSKPSFQSNIEFPNP